MRRHPKSRRGDGTAWLVVDRRTGDYDCSWYAGADDGWLVEQARVASASDAVAWGLLRTPRVRIRTADARTFWAGTAPRPEGFSETWTAPPASSRSSTPPPSER
jgi:cytidine deaminase